MDLQSLNLKCFVTKNSWEFHFALSQNFTANGVCADNPEKFLQKKSRSFACKAELRGWHELVRTMEEPMEEEGQETGPKPGTEEEKRPPKVSSILRPGSMGRCLVFKI